jgi:hypothetical protein
MALREVVLQELPQFPGDVIVPMPHTHLRVKILLLSEGQAGEAWELSNKEILWAGGALDRKVLLHCFYVVLKAKLSSSVRFQFKGAGVTCFINHVIPVNGNKHKLCLKMKVGIVPSSVHFDISIAVNWFY